MQGIKMGCSSECIPWCHSQQISTLLFFHQHQPIFFKLEDTSFLHWHYSQCWSSNGCQGIDWWHT